MKLKVNPTRMELLKLRKRIRLAKRGHKLLKDKEEQLLLEFRHLVEEVRKSRKSAEKNLKEFYVEVLKLKGLLDEKSWENLLETPFSKTLFQMETRRIFNIPVSEILMRSGSEKFSQKHSANPYHYYLVKRGKKIMERLLQLSFLENKLISFAYEIERTRRRVNALEYILIPNLEDTIKFITFKLNETERSSLIMLKHSQLGRQ